MVSSRNTSGEGRRYAYQTLTNARHLRVAHDPAFDAVFQDVLGRRHAARPGRDSLLRILRHGDSIWTERATAFAESLEELYALIRHIVGRGVSIEFEREGWRFESDDSRTQDRLGFLGQVATFIGEPIRREILPARRGTPPPRFSDPSHIADLCRRIHAGERKSHVARELGISRTTLDKYLQMRVTCQK